MTFVSPLGVEVLSLFLFKEEDFVFIFIVLFVGVVFGLFMGDLNPNEFLLGIGDLLFVSLSFKQVLISFVALLLMDIPP